MNIYSKKTITTKYFDNIICDMHKMLEDDILRPLLLEGNTARAAIERLCHNNAVGRHGVVRTTNSLKAEEWCRDISRVDSKRIKCELYNIYNDKRLVEIDKPGKHERRV